MKITVVGAGSIGQRHIRNLLTVGVPAEDITAVDIRSAALERVPDGVRVSRTLSTPRDAVLICTPAAAHADLIRDCIAARVPFFVEKPATLGVEQLTTAEWNYGGPHLVACNMRFTRQFDALAHRASEFWWPSLELHCQSSMASWPGRDYALPVFEFCHEIDVALALFGPATVTSVTALHCERQIRLSHAWWKRSLVRLSWHHAPSIRAWSVTNPPWRDCDFFGAFSDRMDPSMYVHEMVHFLRVVRGEEASCNTLAQARQVVDICEQVERVAVNI